MSVLARFPVLGLFAAHPGTHAGKLRARPAAGDARTDGPPPVGVGAARYPHGGALPGEHRRRPGSAGLPDLAVMPYLRRRLDGPPRETAPQEAVS